MKPKFENLTSNSNVKRQGEVFFSLDAANFALRMRRAVCPAAMKQGKIQQSIAEKDEPLIKI